MCIISSLNVGGAQMSFYETILIYFRLSMNLYCFLSHSISSKWSRKMGSVVSLEVLSANKWCLEMDAEKYLRSLQMTIRRFFWSLLSRIPLIFLCYCIFTSHTKCEYDVWRRLRSASNITVWQLANALSSLAYCLSFRPLILRLLGLTDNSLE